jgi:hypothetical protein
LRVQRRRVLMGSVDWAIDGGSKCGKVANVGDAPAAPYPQGH